MTYNPEIPTDLPPPNVAVNSIRENFSSYATAFSANHNALNDSNQGKHANVIMQQQSGDPGIIGSYDALYCKPATNAGGTANQVFLQIPQYLPNEQPNLPMQLTFSSIASPAIAAGNQFQTFLPGGYIFYFGFVNSVPSPITLSPAPTKILSVIANANNATGGGVPFDSYITNITASTFVINSTLASGSYTFTWMAIAQQ